MGENGKTVGVVYSAEVRNNGTPVLCWDAIKRGLGWGDSVRRYTSMGTLPKHDLFIHIDDGRDDITWECPKPNAYWAVDTHLGYDARLKKARNFDWVFCAQLPTVERFRADGIENVEWLPLACHVASQPNLKEMLAHPELSKLAPRGLDKKWDLVFVGYINCAVGKGFNNRLLYLDELWKEFPNAWLTTNVFFEDMAVRYIQGRVGFNVSIRDDLNMRVFEVLSTGTALLTNRDMVGLSELGLVEGVHYMGYQGVEEAKEKVRWMLANPDEREIMAMSGHLEVREKHTYAQRMQYVLSKFGLGCEGKSLKKVWVE